MANPLSWSELGTWEEDKVKWEMRYVSGIAEKPTFQMQRGIDIHNYLFTGKTPVGYTPDEIRTHDKIRKNFLELEEGPWEHEKKVLTSIGEVPTIGYWDGYRVKTILEVKTGSRLWTEERAKAHGQLYFYATQGLSLGMEIEEAHLFSASTANGSCVRHIVTFDLPEIIKMDERIRAAYEWMISKDMWECRKSSRECLQI